MQEFLISFSLRCRFLVDKMLHDHSPQLYRVADVRLDLSVSCLFKLSASCNVVSLSSLRSIYTEWASLAIELFTCMKQVFGQNFGHEPGSFDSDLSFTSTPSSQMLRQYLHYATTPSFRILSSRDSSVIRRLCTNLSKVRQNYPSNRPWRIIGL